MEPNHSPQTRSNHQGRPRPAGNSSKPISQGLADLGEQDMSKHIPQGRFRWHGPERRAVLPSLKWNIYLVSSSLSFQPVKI